MIKSQITALAIFLTLCFAPCALSDPFADLDVSGGTGIVVGRVSSTDASGVSRRFRIGGLLLSGAINRDLSNSWTGSIQAQMLLDTYNQQMIRQGYSGAISYHLLGGARRIARTSDVAQVISKNPYNLSVHLRGGLFSYAASDPSDAKVKLSGSVWELAPGLEYRQTFSETSAFGTTLLATAINLPASVDRITSRMFEISLFWRAYL